jgi:hypothetical protein
VNCCGLDRLKAKRLSTASNCRFWLKFSPIIFRPLRRVGSIMNTDEIFRRLRIGLSLVVGFFTGKFLATTMQHHASEFFIGGFGVGVVLTQLVCWGVESRWGSKRSE